MTMAQTRGDVGISTENGYKRVKRIAAGRWPTIISSLYPDFAPAMNNPGVTRIPCPLHGSSKGARGDGFRFYEDFAETGGGICNTCGGAASGIDLIKMIEGCKDHEALAILERHLGIETSGARNSDRPVRKLASAQPLPFQPKISPKEIQKRETLLKRIWSEAKCLTDPSALPARQYLHARGIVRDDYLDLQVNLRFHPRLYYASDTEAKQILPGIVATFVDASGDVRGLHRTYLDPQKAQKASVGEAKKALRQLDRTLNGGILLPGAVGITPHVQICEGTENGLSVGMATARSVIACTTAQLLENWVPYQETRFVTVWADNGQAGVLHARNLKSRLEAKGLLCRLLFPWGTINGDDRDWNDILCQEGEDVIRCCYAGDHDQATYE